MRNQLHVATLVAMLGLAATGCGRSVATPAEAESGAEHAHHHHHDGWWCDEHGVPESMCALCNSKLAADFKAKGDWCAEHDRPESQCFLCNPGQQAVFAALYEAKFGKAPPPLPASAIMQVSNDHEHAGHEHDHASHDHAGHDYDHAHHEAAATSPVVK